MMSEEQNRLITRIGRECAGRPIAQRYWQPAALLDELDEVPGPAQAGPAHGPDPRAVPRRGGPLGLIDRDCPHRSADLAFGRLEDGGLRCPFHGWLFDAEGKCLETPAEPRGRDCATTSGRRPIRGGARRDRLRLFGEGTPPAFPDFDCFVAPDSHTFAFKGLWNATGCRRSRSVSIRRTPPSCIASRRTRIPTAPMAASFAAPRPTRTCP